MPSVTLHCHPAALYYFFHEKLYPLGNARVKLAQADIPINQENDFKICFHLMKLILDRTREGAVRSDYFQDITLSGDEEVLAWIILAGPNRQTPPVDH